MKNRKIKVLQAFLESLPFLKRGGCADVIGAIARYIDKDRFECAVIMPDFIFNRANISDAVHILNVDVEFQGKVYDVELKRDSAYDTTFYFLRCDEVFSNSVMFTNDEAQLTRYQFFQYAVLEAIRAADDKPYIIQGHDWVGGLFSSLLKEKRFCDYYGETKSVLCIHNVIWSGSGDLEKGIINSDAVLTVSNAYREEIMTPEYGAGMDALLRKRQDTVYAIRNGVDCLEFDPARDSDLISEYDSPEGKRFNKRYLQESLGLETGEDRFLIGMVSRLYAYKGLDLILESFDGLLKQFPSVQLVILGDGEEYYEKAFRALAEQNAGRVAVMPFFDHGRIMRSVYAGADAYLMPSKTEPCGISQMIAMRYGTVPIVRATGGLKETVIPYGTAGSTGFVFEKYSSGELLEAIRTAEELFRRNRDEWNRLALRCMQADHSWEARIREYEDLYGMLCEQNSR